MGSIRRSWASSYHSVPRRRSARIKCAFSSSRTTASPLVCGPSDDLRAKAVLGDQRLVEPGADLAFVRPGAFGHGADLGGVEVAERVVDVAERDDVVGADLARLRVQGLPQLPAHDLQLHRLDVRSELAASSRPRAAPARAAGRRRAASAASLGEVDARVGGRRRIATVAASGPSRSRRYRIAKRFGTSAR